jgi:parallel beta-helix repeat protein
MKKIVFLVFVLGFLSIRLFVGLVSLVTARGTIYVKSDGSVEPATAPIQRIGNIYTFSANIYDEIVVEKDNVVVDGAGYILQGIGSGTGVDLSERINVTITNMEIGDFLYGVYLCSSLSNSVSGNNLTNNYYGIRFRDSLNNHVSGNNIRSSFYGIWLTGSSNNTINENNITANYNDGIWLSGSSDYNNVSGNNIRNNGHGIRLDDYSNNMFRNNDVSGNEHNFGVYGSLLQEFIQDIDDSNTVNGKPVYYWVNRRDMAVPLDAGWIALVNCTRITVKNVDLTKNGQGILLASTTYSTITKNNITNNIHGIWLSGSSNNTINENNITENAGNGIYLYYSPNNTFYHNNFINNINQVYNVGVSVNVWDNGVEGNYWSDYADRYPSAAELDGSGMWDTSYVIDGNNQDSYPLVPEFPTWTQILLVLMLLSFVLAIYKRRLLKTLIQ